MKQVVPAVQAIGVCKHFGAIPVLSDLCLEVGRGEVAVLVGRNGAGKSTVLRLLNGMLRSDGGTLRVLGRDPIRQANEVRRRVGYVPDAPDAYDWMKPKDWFRFLAPHFPGFDRARAEALCRRMDVPLLTPFRGLSRGQAMKAMLAGALAHDPELLLLDEPFTGLDPLARDDILRAVIEELRGERTVLLSTHDLEVATRVADRVAILDGGRIARETTPEALNAREGEESLPRRLRQAFAETVEAV